MGTNFYVYDKEMKKRRDYMDPQWHIGKRSSAGLYCWDCDITLCWDGNNGIHTGKSNWYDACPECEKKPVDEGWNGTGGRELGFNKEKPRRKTGVASCSSFNWAMDPQILEKLPRRGKPIVNEYGDRYSLKEFLEILSECPIRSYDSIGDWFS